MIFLNRNFYTAVLIIINESGISRIKEAFLMNIQ